MSRTSRPRGSPAGTLHDNEESTVTYEAVIDGFTRFLHQLQRQLKEEWLTDLRHTQVVRPKQNHHVVAPLTPPPTRPRPQGDGRLITPTSPTRTSSSGSRDVAKQSRSVIPLSPPATPDAEMIQLSGGSLAAIILRKQDIPDTPSLEEQDP
jgi:hypothetical protein